MATKPLKRDFVDGQVKEFNSFDRLPNQEQVDYLYELILRILLDYTSQGLTPKDNSLLIELQQATILIK